MSAHIVNLANGCVLWHACVLGGVCISMAACLRGQHARTYACMHQCGHRSRWARARAATSEHCRLRTAAVTVATWVACVTPRMLRTRSQSQSQLHLQMQPTNAARICVSTLSLTAMVICLSFILAQDRPHDTANTSPTYEPLYPKP